MNGGGIGDKLNTEKWEDNNSVYFQRWIFDFIFFIICILLVLNMINGIIVNAFADIRAQGEIIEEESNEKCYMCSYHKSDFQTKNMLLETHISEDHKIKNYIKYIIYLNLTPDNDLDEVSFYIKECIKNNDINIFPNKKTISIDGEDLD